MRNPRVSAPRSLAVEERDNAISAICISPGAVSTDMLRVANPDLKAGLTPQGVANLIAALLDGAVAAASGANIPLLSNR